MNNERGAPHLLFGLIGAVLGGALGYFAFLWIARQGFYALALPGALMGLCCLLLAKRRSIGLAVTCGALALVMGLFCEWRIAPFIKDSSLGFFLTHLHQLRPITYIMIAPGGVLGFWFALGS